MSSQQNGAGAGSHSEADLAQVRSVANTRLPALIIVQGVQGTAARRTDSRRPGDAPGFDREED